MAQAGPPSRPDSRTHPPMRRSMAMLRTLRPGPESTAVRGIVFGAYREIAQCAWGAVGVPSHTTTDSRSM